MPALPFYQVDAFASKPFEGNQACIMPLEAFLPDDVMLAIAAENNVAETAFIVRTGEDSWNLRWFTPAVEVPLCGHATLAAAHVLFAHEGFAGGTIGFDTVKSGRLTVRKLDDGRLEMDFPSAQVSEIDVSDDVVSALGARPLQAWGGMFYAARFATPEDVRALAPDLKALKRLGAPGEGWDRGNFGCFAPGGDGVDVTSRFFAPGSGIDEDPATGSWHTMLARVMSEYSGKDRLTCFQAYPGRGAQVDTHLQGDRVKLGGRAVTVIEGRFHI
ncbi:MAG: PhzF family phenazine biosynthesis protein [Hyphomonas sp. BRH_c22]|uniref:PhzF family phenazine biosynthesis protein n=1 Tax=Hyphomonas sp. BRH_c22 TaxID=1629710 RepID=UPI0005F0F113|nr:PhzF family phenazine biosynthesis protein [Hyphomonas sp. BRH_c22]KJS37860.1 MAG: PhzF family phenazine biosynthesis protein [Hyphomonas sp. BRH_c22]